jgi:hypothetical protein
MVYFQTKNPTLGKFWRALDWKMLIYWEYLMDIWDILISFFTFCVDLGHFYRFGYHVPRKIWQPWTESWMKKTASGPNPTEHNSSNFTHICKIFLQICVKFLTKFVKNESCHFLQIFVSLI